MFRACSESRRQKVKIAHMHIIVKRSKIFTGVTGLDGSTMQQCTCIINYGTRAVLVWSLEAALHEAATAEPCLM
jgi:hypothetical protein